MTGWQTLFWQQPLAHDAALHTHAPFTHASPAPHEGPLPQPHTPLTQLSLATWLQETQAMPPTPHALDTGFTQTRFGSQHPLGQDMASQTQRPFAHRCPLPHAGPAPQAHAPLPHLVAVFGSHTRQAAPPVPHTSIDGAMQVVPLQQPLGHDVASHAQAPFKQR